MGEAGRCELVRGAIVMMSPSSAGHGVVAARLAAIIGGFVEMHDLGVALAAETGFLVETNPDTVRAPDVAVVLKERVAQVIPARGFARGAPDLAVEVLSPDDSWKATVAKAKMWLQKGARSAWIIDPLKQVAEVHTADGRVRRFTGTGILADEAILPGLAIPMTRLFRQP